MAEYTRKAYNAILQSEELENIQPGIGNVTSLILLAGRSQFSFSRAYKPYTMGEIAMYTFFRYK